MSGYFCTSSRLIIATSRAVVWWLSSSVSPQQSVNAYLSYPNDCAFFIHLCNKASSLPQMYSAIATAASLPLATAIHLISVSTVCTSPASRNTCEPPIDCACSTRHHFIRPRWICPVRASKNQQQRHNLGNTGRRADPICILFKDLSRSALLKWQKGPTPLPPPLLLFHPVRNRMP